MADGGTERWGWREEEEKERGEREERQREREVGGLRDYSKEESITGMLFFV